MIAPSPDTVNARLSVREKVGYGLGDMASNLYWKLFEFFQTYFYTNVFGIAPGVAGTMFLITKLWDAINDPLIGFVADRTKTSWGRFRPYLLWMCVPFAVTGILAFYTPDLSDRGKIVYAYITYTLVFMAYTAVNIPYGALMGVISPSSIERTSVSTYRFVAAFIGGIIVQRYTETLVEYFGGTKTAVVDGVETTVVDQQTGFFWTMVVYSVAAVILFLICFATTKERVQPDAHQRTSFRRDVSDLIRNRPWLVLFAFGLFQLMAAFVRGGTIAFYFVYYVDQSFGGFLVAGTVAGIAGMLLTRFLTQIFGKKTLMIGMNIGTAICTAAIIFLEPHQVTWMSGLYIVGAIISGPSPVLLWAMYADVADYSEWLNHRRATGLVFSAATFSQKLGCAIGAALSGWLLQWYAFQPPENGVDRVQSESTINGICLMMSVIPAAFLVFAAMALLFYNIDERKIKQIESDLHERKSQSSRDTENIRTQTES